MLRASIPLVLSLSFASPLRSADVFPIEDVRPGMIGVGRTVFAGSKIDEFKVEVLGVLPNIGPKRSLILARLEGGPLEKSGVIAGMSGSPVFIEGKLVGAVAFGVPFSKETIAGITPINEMIEATSTSSGRAASARFPSLFRAGAPALPLDRDSLLSGFPPKILPALEAPTFSAQTPLLPIPLCMVFSGFDPRTFDWAKGVFSELGFTPIAGGGAGNLPALPDLAPGSPMGVSLVEGDLELSVTGTVTAIDHDRVYAFGHPFYNLGPTQFPLKKAYVYSVFPSLYQSFKISATGESVGTLDQDRQTAVSGVLGPTPRMIPQEITVTTSRGQEHRYSLRLVDDELLSPLLSYISLLSVLQSNERSFGTASVRLEAHLRLAGGAEVRLEDLFSNEQPSQQAAALVAAPLGYLLANDFTKVRVEGVDVHITSYETPHRASLERTWIDRSAPLRPGSRASLRLLLRTYRGERFEEKVPLEIPAATRPGNYSLLVMDGPTLSGLEQRELRQPFVPKDLGQMIRALNGLRRGNRIYVRLVRPGEGGAVVSGEFLPSLPPSVLSVLRTGDQGGAVMPTANSSVWEFELPTAYAFSGSRVLPVTIEP